MTKDFQNQQPSALTAFNRVSAKPQHGQKPDADCLKIKEKRSFEPRPAH
jgi:hypothetical protein